MKKLVWITIVTIIAVPLLAQEETLFSGRFESGGFGGPVWKASAFDGEFGLMSGGRGGWIINHTLVIGGGGYSTTWDIKTDLVNDSGEELFLEMSYGGLDLEYIKNSDEMIHYTFGALFGAGTVRLEAHDPQEKYKSDTFFIMEPAANIEINIFQWFRVCGGVSYRFVTAIDEDVFDSMELSGIAGTVTLKFGAF